MSARPPSRTILEKQPAFWAFERLDTSRTLTAFKLQDFDQARQIFETLLKEFGDDGPARFYLDLCRQFETVPPQPPWTGCVRL